MRVCHQPTPAQVVVSAETTRQCTAVCAPAASPWAQTAVRLHHAPARSPLVRDHYVRARVQATEAITSAFALAKQGGQAAAPRSHSCSPRDHAHTFRVVWANASVRLSTMGGKQTIPFAGPAPAAHLIGGRVGTSDRLHRAGRRLRPSVVGRPAPAVAPCPP